MQAELAASNAQLVALIQGIRDGFLFLYTTEVSVGGEYVIIDADGNGFKLENGDYATLSTISDSDLITSFFGFVAKFGS